MKLLEFFKELHDESLELAEYLRFDKKHPWHFNLISLYGSLVELSGGIIILINNKAFTGIPSIFRTFLETFVEFQNLANDKKYGYCMEASNLKQWLKIYREAKRGSNPYLEEIGKLPILDEEISRTERRLKDLKQEKFEELSIKKKFKIAGLADVYSSIYNFLCTDSHSNIRALIKRHADITEKDFTVVFYKDEPLESFITTIDTSCGLLIEASLNIHGILGSPKHKSLEELKAKFEQIREEELD